MSVRSIWRTPLGAVLLSFAAIGVVLLAVCLTMIEHVHFWLVLPYALLALFPVIALVVYAIQNQHSRDRYRRDGEL